MEIIDHNRRAFLESAAVAVSGPYLGRLPNQEDSPEVTSVKVQRSYSNPLTREEVQELQNEAIEKHRDQTGSTKPIGKGSIGPNDGFPTTSFVYMIDKDSRSRYYIGQSSDPECAACAVPPPKVALERVHSAAISRLETAEETNSVVKSSEELNEPKKSQALRAKYVAGGTAENVIIPYGKIVAAVELYRFGVLYGIRHNLTIIPGIHQFGQTNESDEKWRNRQAQVAHRWDRNDFEQNSLLIGHEPNGYHDGEERSVVQLDTGSDSLEWAYTQPDVERKDKTGSKIAEWIWTWNSDKAKESTAVFKLGSLIQPPETASIGDRVTATQSQATFRKRTSPAEEQSIPTSQSIALG